MENSDRGKDPLHRIAIDPDSFEVFYRTHFGRVINFVARRCFSPEDVADIVADVFVEAIRSSERFDPSRGEPLAWLLGIASNLLSSSWRAEGRRRKLVAVLSGRELLVNEDYAWLEDRIDAARLTPAAEHALGRLSDRERSVVELVDVEGLSTVETADALGIRPASARMRLTRGRRKLRRIMGATYQQTGSLVTPQRGDAS
jgi:RNA polymerase sigma factor (sigma-70 family)